VRGPILFGRAERDPVVSRFHRNGAERHHQQARPMAEIDEQLTRLMAWYAAHRNDDWEHGHGLKLEEIEGSGKSIIIDVGGTPIAGLTTEKQRIERSETDWLEWWFEPAAFRAIGGRRNVGEMIERFFQEIDALVGHSQP
jgi:hypothetical protein